MVKYKTHFINSGSTPNEMLNISHKSKNYRKVMNNIIHQCHIFNKMAPKPRLKYREFIITLYKLSEHCKYDEMRDELICDHIVLGICDSDLSKCMQLTLDLMLNNLNALYKCGVQ